MQKPDYLHLELLLREERTMTAWIELLADLSEIWEDWLRKLYETGSD